VQLVNLLLFVVAVLTICSGLTVFLGSKRQDRKLSKYFFFATLCCTLWTVGIALFLGLKPAQADLAKALVFFIYIPALFMDVSMIAYLGKGTLGKVATYVSLIFGVFMTSVFLYDPSVLYSGITITSGGNAVELVTGWYYITYIIYFVSMTAVILGFLFYSVRHTYSKGRRNGLLIFLVGLSAAGALALIFDVILPPTKYDTIWVGPLAMSAMLIAYYYSVLKYRIVSLSAKWLKALTYAVLICTFSVVYMIVFFIIFTAIFKVPNPSTSIFVLNFIMITIVLLLLPILNELLAFIRSLIQSDSVDIAYMVKRLNRMTTNVNLNELADFLADNMHFSYIGLLVDGKLYGSNKTVNLNATELKQIAALKKPEDGRIWQKFSDKVSDVFNREDIKAAAMLLDAKGKPFGQILVGKPLGKMGFERKDLVQIEMIINLVAAMIDTKAK